MPAPPIPGATLTEAAEKLEALILQKLTEAAGQFGLPAPATPGALPTPEQAFPIRGGDGAALPAFIPALDRKTTGLGVVAAALQELADAFAARTTQAPDLATLRAGGPTAEAADRFGGIVEALRAGTHAGATFYIAPGAIVIEAGTRPARELAVEVLAELRRTAMAQTGDTL